MALGQSTGTPSTCIGPVHHIWRHAADAVIGVVVVAQQGLQEMHKALHILSCHVAVVHALQSPLSAFCYGAVYVIIADERVNGPGLEQVLESRHAHLSPLVALYHQQQLLHAIQDGHHGTGHLDPMLADQRAHQGISLITCLCRRTGTWSCRLHFSTHYSQQGHAAAGPLGWT